MQGDGWGDEAAYSSSSRVLPLPDIVSRYVELKVQFPNQNTDLALGLSSQKLRYVRHWTDKRVPKRLFGGMPQSRSAWTPEDSERLKNLVASGASPARASVIFKRSVGAVQNHARKLGTPFPPRHDIRREILAKCEAAEKSLRE